MAKAARKKGIHRSVKIRLGYSPDEPDKDVLRDWKKRLRRVCKPCWELKYCPYGPLVEQSPLHPSTLSETEEHISYLKSCLEMRMLGGREPLSDERRSFYREWLKDEQFIIKQAFAQLQEEKRVQEYVESGSAANDLLHSDLPPIHIYRVPYQIEDKPIRIDDFDYDTEKSILDRVEVIKKQYNDALESGIDDYKRPIDPVRKARFEEEIAKFNPDNHPEEIPEIFGDGACNIFGHICPVFFAAEAFTETSSERRHGRYISFAMKMRIVRRDNHTCQICGAHLRDDEVEFDHIIPVSRGGSSEEHNIRLTCFDCNRDKKDRIFV